MDPLLGTNQQFDSTLEAASPWRRIYVGVLTQVAPHPNADREVVVEVDTGWGKLTVVTGGPHIEVGHKVAVALPGARVVDASSLSRARASSRKGASGASSPRGCSAPPRSWDSPTTTAASTCSVVTRRLVLPSPCAFPIQTHVRWPNAGITRERKEHAVFDESSWMSINRRCLEEALSVQDMLSPAPPTRTWFARAHDRCVAAVDSLRRGDPQASVANCIAVSMPGRDQPSPAKVTRNVCGDATDSRAAGWATSPTDRQHSRRSLPWSMSDHSSSPS